MSLLTVVRLHWHKDYLFQKRLALQLPIDSFRFDFRGNHETPGPWRLGNFNDDVLDIHVVVEYLTKELGYVVDLLVGHSRGSVTGMMWLCQYPAQSATVRGYANVSGRYRLYPYRVDPTPQKLYDQMRKPENWKQIEAKGYYELTATVARKPFYARVTVQDHDQFASGDSSIVWEKFPQSIDVLTMHGLKDTVVPPSALLSYDAFIYAQALGARSPGTHNLCYVEDADHNFTGVRLQVKHLGIVLISLPVQIADQVVATVLEWYAMLEHKELKTGIWHTGVKPKL
ncbi:hypothetical protein POSPLDRAFT_91504 [Postia placenta Mad-698-R]|uniref:AB hydrolase-1 domain-containing protein n=1 Tax=Postia placenta MAD-698-R-SB12 TaxID=670580 RepID=A0A1X6MTV8_9APHY|nr:hypothetical protein POSPLADRAFT_1149428 [Postia placenta MAD-698-R-SB12]EED86003.1 hypothetical protein POSPLDRAFT_91504 [Postia placenta Mad-698-R]OSX59814.1 hypothetical protein POSPLADRAFT_1149428 [Postia placenta MAD-698-R-SB12]